MSIQETTPDEPAKIKHSYGINIQGWNKPWIMLTVPALAGAVWLANNTWIITNNLDKPYALLFWPSLLATIVAGWMIFNFFKTIAAWCREFWKASISYLKQPGSKYWIATSIFLIVSMMESGTCFGTLLGGQWHDRLIGYAIAIAIDSVSVICILARQGAVRRSDNVGQILYMVGIIVCASLSTIANGYIAKEKYVAPHGMDGEIWYGAAMLLMIAPPLLVVFLGFASDYTTDQAGAVLDPDEFEKTETARIRFKEIRRDSIRKYKAIQAEIDTMNGKLQKPKRTFILLKWLFTEVQQNDIEVTSLQTSIEAIEKRLTEISTSIAEMPKLKEDVSTLQQNVFQYRADIIEVQASIETSIRATNIEIETPIPQAPSADIEIEIEERQNTEPLKLQRPHPRITRKLKSIETETSKKRGLGKKAQDYCLKQLQNNHFPTLKEITEAIGCGDATASTARSEALKLKSVKTETSLAAII